MNDPDICPQCKKQMILKPLRPFPVALQSVFGVSFIAFILIFDDIKQHTWLLWLWSIIQIALGYGLVRGRILARRKVYRCVNCTPDL